MTTPSDFFDNCVNGTAKSSQVPAPEWLRRMREDYQKTGKYRSEDLRRLLGDQTQAVSSPDKPPQKP
jgi:hypothetical protein